MEDTDGVLGACGTANSAAAFCSSARVWFGSMTISCGESLGCQLDWRFLQHNSMTWRHDFNNCRDVTQT